MLCFKLKENIELDEMNKSLLLLCVVGAVFQAVSLDARSLDLEDETCTTDEGKSGLCVVFYLCDRDNNNTMIYDGAGVLDIRSHTDRLHRSTRDLTIREDQSSSVQAHKCKSYIDVCCNSPDNTITPRPESRTDQVQVRPESRKSDNTITLRPEKQIRKPDRGCGWRNPDGVGFNTTGDKDGESKFGEFPWMVAIFRIEESNRKGQLLNVFVGGGSLIHPAVVLTTAHHVGTPETLKVRAGEWDTQAVDEKYPYQETDVYSVVVHKDFNTERNNLFYDIALLFLSSPMDVSIPNVGLACLPPPRQLMPGGVRCVASGWGTDKFERWTVVKYRNILNKVTVPVVERDQCQTQLRKTHLGHFFELHSSFMCAGGEAGIDTCTGDGGSPLMCPIESQPNRYMQSGMVAWGTECGKEGTPGVYVDVSNLRDWIDEKIVGYGFDPMVYTF